MFLWLLFFQGFGAGPVPTIQDPSTLTRDYEKLEPIWIGVIKPYALELFGALAFLDLAFFGWSLWKEYRGDVTVAIMSTTNRLLLIGLFLDLLLNGPAWGTAIINDFITVGKAGRRLVVLPQFSPAWFYSGGPILSAQCCCKRSKVDCLLIF
jgi:hypothetical protein